MQLNLKPNCKTIRTINAKYYLAYANINSSRKNICWNDKKR